VRRLVRLLGVLALAGSAGLGSLQAQAACFEVGPKDSSALALNCPCAGKEVIYYVEVDKKAANLRKAPVIRKDTVVGLAHYGDIFPVYRLVEKDGQVWYQVGCNLYLHSSVAEITPFY